MHDEWYGQTSSKFRGHKLHVQEPIPKDTKHPLYQAEQKKHFDAKLSQEFKWKPSIKLGEGDKISPCMDEYIPPKNKIERKFTDTRQRPEKKHLVPEKSGSFEDMENGLRTFIDIHQRKSVNEYS